MAEQKTSSTRYELGGDEFIFVELSESMNLEAMFKGMAITNGLAEEKLDGIMDICPGNASYMIRLNPEVIHPQEVIEKLKKLEASTTDYENIAIESRVIDVPVLFEDPWTHEALMRFRKNHQDPDSTDLEYCARINGFDSKQDLIRSIVDYPFLVSMVGFVPGLPFTFQLTSQEKQIEVPKYVTPRTFTPERAFGFGGAFAVIYPVQGAGGYQLFGTAAAPILDVQQQLPDFKESMVFPRQGDILRYRDVDRDEYDSIRQEVEAGTFRYKTEELSFTPGEVMSDPQAFAEKVMRRLYHD
ncbi:5-oxoprolinase subunit B family protein [Fictibacillus fluitans]|uniref:Carboxyltransferase domain-containing protein n=1 Tax=Fictibacillus fluitans TaxID=3058422 RepID=A0ABT8HSZ4_9BACL|nr:carboxyltransferase domain-containing protein [Fictibacillus sp. NE201]MDN4523897.1 carboxyltransferase domain-containing protein [Fictibacillus sp. NE201]